MQIKPTKGHLLIQPYEKPKEAGGLMLAGDEQNAAPVRGEILDVPKPSPFNLARFLFWPKRTQLHKGQTVYFRKYAIDELSFIDDSGTEDKVWLVDEREVLAYIED